MKTLSLKLPDDVAARLSARAKATGKTKSELTRTALEHLLSRVRSSDVSSLDLIRDLVGSARGPSDLASNRKYLRDYGR